MSTLPITLLAAQKVLAQLTGADALGQQIRTLAQEAGITLPVITPSEVVLSSVAPDLGDKNLQLTYPRICLYSGGLKNTQTEKFRSLSGSAAVIVEIWASGNMVTQADEWIHFYVEAVTGILRRNIGDWGDGIFFPGTYDIQFQQPKAGGFGFVQSAKVTCSLNVSRN